MDDDPHPQRDTFLTLLLATLAGAGGLTFLVAVTGGWFLFLVVAAASIAVLAFLHYLLWGYSLSEEVAGEREEEANRLAMEEEADDWPERNPRDFGRY